MRQNRGLVVLLGLVLAMVAGCGAADVPGPAPTPETPLPKVSHPQAEVPKDRDQQAVVAALRQLDACALLDAKNAKQVVIGPHRCVVRRDNGDEIKVIVGSRFDSGARYNAEPVTIDGVKAYNRPSDEAAFCRGLVPVSFTLAIEFWADNRNGSKGPCRDVVPAALRHAVAKLADQGAPRPGPSRPLANWDACLLLSGARDDYEVAVVDGDYGVDSCAASKAKPDSISAEYRLTIKYDIDPLRGAKKTSTIGGKPVRVNDSAGDCAFLWSAGQVPDAGFDQAQQVVEVHAKGCGQGEVIVPKIMESLSKEPPTKSVKPQKPLTYRPDEPDTAFSGACVDYSSTSDTCQPYVEVPVPSGRKEIFRAAEADPNVICAVTREAVAKHFGAASKPVTSNGQCYFVEPVHAVQIAIDFDSRSRPSGAAKDSISLAGHPGYRTIEPHDGWKQQKLNVSSEKDAASDGVLMFTVVLHRGRGQSQLDESAFGKLEPAVTDILTRYFG